MSAPGSLWTFFRRARCRMFGHAWDTGDAQLEWCKRCGNGRLGEAHRAAARAFANGTWRFHA